MEAGWVTVEGVGIARAEGEKGSGPCKVVWAKVTDARDGAEGEGVGLNDWGLNRKSRDQDLGELDRELGEPFIRSWVRRLEARGSFDVLLGNSEAGIGWKATDGRLRSSRTSRTVNAAYPGISTDFVGNEEKGPGKRVMSKHTCIGPRRPTTRTRFIRLLLNVSRA